jgi:DNA-binding HxlR family transcriptional regulator
MRSYGQHCALAKALDLVGDRWTLLIVRELLIRGACRYTDLRTGLPGIATNLLVDRLKQMERGGIVQRQEAPPPIATTLFQLTPRGQELEPILLQLGRWGAPLLGHTGRRDTFRSHWLSLPLSSYLSDRMPEDPAISIELRTGDEPITIETVGDGTVRARPGSTRHAALILTGKPEPIMAMLSGKLELSGARSAGIQVDGDPGVLSRLQARI